ncbi:MAG: DUF4329 domain-containing protein, partial [Pseudomonadota bacterium]
MRTYAFLATSALALAVTSATAQDTAEVQFARQVLNQLNTLSFQNNREYCGYFGFDSSGAIVATPAKKGRQDSCLANEPDPNLDIFASYHTHGAFSEDALSEWPSSADLEGDEEEGIDGYVATPGGRMWYIDSQDMVASQLCSIGCLVSDPAFQQGMDGTVNQSYSY